MNTLYSVATPPPPPQLHVLLQYKTTVLITAAAIWKKREQLKMGNQSRVTRPTSTVSVTRSSLYVRQEEYIIIVEREEIEIPQEVQQLYVIIIPRTAQRSIRSQPSLSPQFEETPQGYLICSKKECLFIGSYGDKKPKGVTIAPKVVIEKTSAYLPKITDDLKRFRHNCSKDPHKVLDESHVYQDRPGKQLTKEYYLTQIASFLKNCKEPGGNKF